MGNSRRTFIKQAAGFTAACFAGLDAESATGADSSLFDKERVDGDMSGWYDRPMRWAQLAFVEDDPGNYDLSFWLDYFRRDPRRCSVPERGRSCRLLSDRNPASIIEVDGSGPWTHSVTSLRDAGSLE